MKRILVLVVAIGVLSFCVYAEAGSTRTDLKKAEALLVQAERSGDVLIYEEAAKLGNVKAQTKLAKRYLKGEGVGQNDQEAYRWFLVAATQRDPEALHHLAMFPEEGRVEPVDLSKAVVLYEKAARLGYIPSQLSLASLYRKVTPVNLKKSVHWFQLAANRGSAQAQWELGKAYEQGLGVKADQSLAKAWYRKAAQQGLSLASDSLKNLEGTAKPQ